MNVLVFDIETVPDIEAGRRVYGLGDLPDSDVAKAMFHLRSQQNDGVEFLRHHLHRVVAISAVFRDAQHFRVWSLGDERAGEREIIQRFFDGIEKYSPMLVSWNGSGFDLPVLHYRALRHGVRAARYWDTGDDDRDFRWNNYLNRFHFRHLDLMDIISGYQARAAAPLDEIATVLGFPGKMGMSGAHVWEAFLEGDLRGIRNYCETDVLNTYLVYLRFELIRGRLTLSQHDRELQRVKDYLAAAKEEHLQQFLRAWQESASLSEPG